MVDGELAVEYGHHEPTPGTPLEPLAPTGNQTGFADLDNLPPVLRRPGVPTRNEVRKGAKKKLWDNRNRPYFLPTWRDAWASIADVEGKVARNPAGCVGHWKRTREGGGGAYGKRVRLCERPTYCLFCWERHRRAKGLQAIKDCTGYQEFLKGSCGPFRKLRTQEDAQKLQADVYEWLRGVGYEVVVVYVHAHGSQMAEGTKPHVDFYAAGKNPLPIWNHWSDFPPADEWLDDNAPASFRKWYGRRTVKPKVRQLYHAGRYAGRVTWDVPLLFHGINTGSGRLRVRSYNARETKVEKWTQHDLEWDTIRRLQTEADEWVLPPKRSRSTKSPDEALRRIRAAQAIDEFAGDWAINWRLSNYLSGGPNT